MSLTKKPKTPELLPINKLASKFNSSQKKEHKWPVSIFEMFKISSYQGKQFKTILGDHLPLVRWLSSSNLTNIMGRLQQKRTLLTLMESDTMDFSVEAPQKIKI